MLTPTDNALALADSIRSIIESEARELLNIERALIAAPGYVHLLHRKGDILSKVFVLVNDACDRYQTPVHSKPALPAAPEPRLDSRIIADKLGVEHKNLLTTIARYQAELETFGSLAFETRVRDRQGIPTRFATLNENQCYFLATLSRNTKQVVAFKMWLVKTFDEYRNGKATEQLLR